jgi:hypothetical protein
LDNPRRFPNFQLPTIGVLKVKLALSKDSSLVKPPPSEAAFRQHILRVAFQVYVWTHANDARPPLTTADKFCSTQTQFHAANGLAFTHTYKVLQEVRRHGFFKVLWH